MKDIEQSLKLVFTLVWRNFLTGPLVNTVIWPVVLDLPLEFFLKYNKLLYFNCRGNRDLSLTILFEAFEVLGILRILIISDVKGFRLSFTHSTDKIYKNSNENSPN